MSEKRAQNNQQDVDMKRIIENSMKSSQIIDENGEMIDAVQDNKINDYQIESESNRAMTPEGELHQEQNHADDTQHRNKWKMISGMIAVFVLVVFGCLVLFIWKNGAGENQEAQETSTEPISVQEETAFTTESVEVETFASDEDRTKVNSYFFNSVYPQLARKTGMTYAFLWIGNYPILIEQQRVGSITRTMMYTVTMRDKVEIMSGLNNHMDNEVHFYYPNSKTGEAETESGTIKSIIRVTTIDGEKVCELIFVNGTEVGKKKIAMIDEESYMQIPFVDICEHGELINGELDAGTTYTVPEIDKSGLYSTSYEEVTSKSAEEQSQLELEQQQIQEQQSQITEIIKSYATQPSGVTAQ